MSQPLRDTLKVQARRAVLVGLFEPGISAAQKEHALDELAGLAETAGCEIVGRLIQLRDSPDPATFLGKGKIEELRLLMERNDAELAIFDNSLSPSQGKNIESAVKSIVVDRSEVILDIFATHARTYEAKLQVELAQLLYMRPRLKRMWTHLERIEGGIGSGRGPGEKQLELDRRMLDKRVSELRKKLESVEKRRERLVASRNEHFTVSLVGYTNAGKSTLMQALTGSEVYIANQLFATLDTKTRRWSIPKWGDILLSDTVGFVRDLPHHLVASFKSTLEEALQADLLLHVVDASNPDAMKHIETVESVLEEIGAGKKRTILVLNKVDRVPGHEQFFGDTDGHPTEPIEDRSWYDIVRHKFRDAISVSAVTGEGLTALRQAVIDELSRKFSTVDITASVSDGKLPAILGRLTEIEKTTYTDSEAVFRCRLPDGVIDRLEREHQIQVNRINDLAETYSHPSDQ
ncbi:GTPase HflX [Rubinisphaera margarita]|uniref:GTPase HflX n=1 Tax=Rubinisphaera margarita TaxID=2909586 RepID=UPI001EE95E1A|nr:GTPase HflX [Rubinisphaera margarita]MCG6156821.1 GTPase HflX [Rubinisphaera margarita]